MLLDQLVDGRSQRGNVDRNILGGNYGTDYYVVPYVGTWIEIWNYMNKYKEAYSRSLRGNVDRNSSQRIYDDAGLCRSLRGNVDRNTRTGLHRGSVTIVVPYVGTWIEMRMSTDPPRRSRVVPYVGTWIEIYSSVRWYSSAILSFPTWERG